MKEFWYKYIDEYLEKADTYDNPKIVKMFEILGTEEIGKKLFRAVTYLRTAIIGFQEVVDESKIDELAKKCKAHEHSEGVIIEVGRVE